MIYVITTFEKVDRNAGYWIKYGSQRTVGYYFNYEDALEVLTNNVCDLWEYCYDYAALEACQRVCIHMAKMGMMLNIFIIISTKINMNQLINLRQSNLE